MKLFNTFFTIITSDFKDGELIYNVNLNKEHYIYKAHFPNNPITPGVCILQMIQELIEQYLNINLELQILHNIKYMSIISPISNPEIAIHISYSHSNENVKVKGIIKTENIVFTKLSATYHKL